MTLSCLSLYACLYVCVVIPLYFFNVCVDVCFCFILVLFCFCFFMFVFLFFVFSSNLHVLVCSFESLFFLFIVLFIDVFWYSKKLFRSLPFVKAYTKGVVVVQEGSSTPCHFHIGSYFGNWNKRLPIFVFLIY